LGAFFERSLSLIEITASIGGAALAAAPVFAMPVVPGPTTVPAAPVAPTMQAIPPAAPAIVAGMGAVIPQLTPVKVEIRAQLISKVTKPGTFFPLRLAEPILVNGAVAIPAGTEGMGEVVESKGGGMAGSPGVLILAARYLTVDGRTLRLRSMHIVQTGTNNQDSATAVGVLLGFPGLFITGGKTIVAEGTIAAAKTAEVFVLTPSAATSAPTTSVTGPLIAAAPSPAISTRGNSQ
jgi:hypothetical protein